MVWAESNYSWGEAGTKKFLCFSFSLASTICLTQLPRQASFAASGHITLKSFGHVLKKYCHTYRCKWDGRLGTACNVFELVEFVSVLNAQRIFTNKRKGCWFKTQKVWGKFQRKVVLLNLNCFFVTRLNICRGKSHSPEGAHNTFEKERICFWGFFTNFTCNIFWNTHFP